MPTTRFRRQFASGCRPAPDPYDKFLDNEGFYRKHTARDASSLFRAISEQLFDSQIYHEQVRSDCVQYMLKHRSVYAKSVATDFDAYITEMAKPKTYGTLLELRAMAYLYKRNILLYQPYDLGVWLVKEIVFQKPFLRIFYAPQKHYDSVFTKSFIVKAAFCQAISYEILYKNVYQLADVEFAVETMLHGAYENDMQKGSFNNGQRYGYGGNKYSSHLLLDDGRKFQLDKSENTKCILDNFLLCHFHNPNFNMSTITNNTVMMGNSYSSQVLSDELLGIQHIVRACLPDKHVSCVRQLLNEGITPFPYKVAKALDPDIYRNIEFDSWSDHRKESRHNSWYTDDSSLQIGVKCMCKLRESQQDLYKCHIQEMSPNKGPCLVFVEELAEKHSIPYSYLKPLPQYRYFYNRHSNGPFELLKGKKCSEKRGKIDALDWNKCSKRGSQAYKCIENAVDLNQFTDISNFQPYSYEIVAMPLTSISRSDRTGNRANNRNNTNNQANQANNEKPPAQAAPPADDANDFNRNNGNNADGQAQPQDVQGSNMPTGYAANNHGLVQYYLSPNPGSEYSDPMPYPMANAEMVGHPNMYQMPPPYGNSSTVYTSMPVGHWPNYNQPIGSGNWYGHNMYPSGNGYFVPMSGQPMQGMIPLTIRRRDLLWSSNGRVNLGAAPSYAPNGSDLPMNDLPSLRFFYNLGHEFYKNLQASYGCNVMAILENEGLPVINEGLSQDGGNSLANDFQQMGIEQKDADNQSVHAGNKTRDGGSYYLSNNVRRTHTYNRNKKDGKPIHPQPRLQGNQGYHNKNNPRHHNPNPSPASEKNGKGDKLTFGDNGSGSSYQHGGYSHHYQGNGNEPNQVLQRNAYTPNGGNHLAPRGTSGPNVMTSPCDPGLDSNEPVSMPFYGHGGIVYQSVGPTVPPQPYNFWYPPPANPVPLPQSSLNSSSSSTVSANAVNNMSNPSQ